MESTATSSSAENKWMDSAAHFNNLCFLVNKDVNYKDEIRGIYGCSLQPPRKFFIPIESFHSFSQKYLSLLFNGYNSTMTIQLQKTGNHLLCFDIDIKNNIKENIYGPLFVNSLNSFIDNIVNVFGQFFKNIQEKVSSKTLTFIEARRNTSFGVHLHLLNIVINYTDYLILCGYLSELIEQYIREFTDQFNDISISIDTPKNWSLPFTRAFKNLDDGYYPYRIHHFTLAPKKIQTYTSYDIIPSSLFNINKIFPKVKVYSDLYSFLFPIPCFTYKTLTNENFYYISSKLIQSFELLIGSKYQKIGTIKDVKSPENLTHLYKDTSSFDISTSNNKYFITPYEHKFLRSLGFSKYLIDPWLPCYDLSVSITGNQWTGGKYDKLIAILEPFFTIDCIGLKFSGDEKSLYLLCFELCKLYSKTKVKQILLDCKFTDTEHIDTLLQLFPHRKKCYSTSLRGIKYNLCQHKDIKEMIIEQCQNKIYDFLDEENETSIAGTFANAFKTFAPVSKLITRNHFFVFDPNIGWEEKTDDVKDSLLNESFNVFYEKILIGIEILLKNERELLLLNKQQEDENESQAKYKQFKKKKKYYDNLKSVTKRKLFFKEACSQLPTYWELDENYLSRINNKFNLYTDLGLINLLTMKIYTINPEIGQTRCIPLSEFIHYVDTPEKLLESYKNLRPSFTDTFLTYTPNNISTFLESVFLTSPNQTDAFQALINRLQNDYPEIPLCAIYFITFLILICAGNEEWYFYLMDVTSEILIEGNFFKFIYFFYGPNSNNGKTSLIQLYRKILGPFLAYLSKNTLYKKNNESTQTDLYVATGARLLVLDELTDQVIDSALLKALSGSKEHRVRAIYSEGKNVVITYKVLLASNEKLNVTYDEAILRRLRPICFNSSFVNEFPEGNIPLSTQFNNKTFLIRKTLENEMTIIAAGALYLAIKNIQIKKEIWQSKNNNLLNLYILDATFVPAEMKLIFYELRQQDRIFKEFLRSKCIKYDKKRTIHISDIKQLIDNFLLTTGFSQEPEVLLSLFLRKFADKFDKSTSIFNGLCQNQP